ncbi:MAG TPA: Type 1 glutamine amidotransferase-like domain-containing protein [Vicinamibacterales bacterium]|nr:Type 1 glutamine amidotransferase-like domain-containing protein [Vicinamibacterales bacterium]
MMQRQDQQLRLVLTSNFPSTSTDAVSACLRGLGTDALVAWIPPLTSKGRERFPAAQQSFRSLGVSALEFCDIDEEPDERQLARLDRYDALYLTGGDPLVFRRNIERSGMAEGLRAFVSSGRLVIAASGGAMQFTANVSLYRLLASTVDVVAGEHGDYAGLGLVGYELLPHLNTLDPVFVDKVQRYSERVPCDIVALEDGAAILHESGGRFRTAGRVVRFRAGIRTAIEIA